MRLSISQKYLLSLERDYRIEENFTVFKKIYYQFCLQIFHHQFTLLGSRFLVCFKYRDQRR